MDDRAPHPPPHERCDESEEWGEDHEQSGRPQDVDGAPDRSGDESVRHRVQGDDGMRADVDCVGADRRSAELPQDQVGAHPRHPEPRTRPTTNVTEPGRPPPPGGRPEGGARPRGPPRGGGEPAAPPTPATGTSPRPATTVTTRPSDWTLSSRSSRRAATSAM